MHSAVSLSGVLLYYIKVRLTSASFIISFIRGVRIYKVMYYYEDYWNLMKKYDERNIERRVSTFMNREEQLRLEKAR